MFGVNKRTLCLTIFFLYSKNMAFMYSYVSVDEAKCKKNYIGGFQMNHEVEKYVGELRELREQVDFMKARIKKLESELEWRI